MDLDYAYRVMAAATRGESAGLPITQRDEQKKLQEMAAAGLVEITAEGTDVEPVLRLEGLTNLGRTFLRAFRTGAPGTTFPISVKKCTETQERADSCAAAGEQIAGQARRDANKRDSLVFLPCPIKRQP